MTTPQEAGSREDLRSEIVTEAARLLREKGADAVTTRAVAQAAGVQAPTIYRLFGDKDGLVDAVAEHVMADYVTAKAADEAAATADPVADLRAAWRRHVDFGLANPELSALLGAPARSARSPATVAGIAVLRGRIGRLAAAGLLRVEEPLALSMVHAAGTGTVLALLGTPLADRDPALAEVMFDAVLGHLLVEVPAVPDASTRAVAVAFASAVPDLPGLSEAERAVLAEWVQRALAALRHPS